jgi:uncharacterized protein (DUF58 family)
MFLISDFELPEDGGVRRQALERAAQPVAARHDLIAVEIRDPHERTLPDLGLVTLEDAETGQVVVVDSGRSRTRRRFAELAEARRSETHRGLKRLGAEVLPLDTARPYERELLAFFDARERGRSS